MRHTRSMGFVLLIAALAVAGVSGCAKKTAKVSSAWPEARGEREVAQPPAKAVWPYTGLEAPSAEAVTKRPLSIKVENSPAARPQFGLNSADVVNETITEGGITRFNCVFHSVLPKTIGPVRSARLSDLWLVPQYDGLFFFSGAHANVENAVNRADIDNLSQDAGVSYPYSRSSRRNAPHNLMLDTRKAYEEAKKRKKPLTARLESLQFSKRSRAASAPVSQVDVPFSQANDALWKWDPGTGRFLRWTNGKAHRDGTTGDQISADNVVVMWAKYTEADRDMIGSVTYDVNLGATGRVSVFRDGGRIDGTWKGTRNAPPRFVDSAGAAIKLAPGRTWFQIVPSDTKITMR